MLIITCKQFDKHIILSCRKMARHYLGNLTQLFHYMGKITRILQIKALVVTRFKSYLIFIYYLFRSFKNPQIRQFLYPLMNSGSRHIAFPCNFEKWYPSVRGYKFKNFVIQLVQLMMSHGSFTIFYNCFIIYFAKIVINLHYSSNEHVNFVRIYSNNYFSATSSNKRNYNL